jgi:hypothetical protein
MKDRDPIDAERVFGEPAENPFRALKRRYGLQGRWEGKEQEKPFGNEQVDGDMPTLR